MVGINQNLHDEPKQLGRAKTYEFTQKGIKTIKKWCIYVTEMVHLCNLCVFLLENPQLTMAFNTSCH